MRTPSRLLLLLLPPSSGASPPHRMMFVFWRKRPISCARTIDESTIPGDSSPWATPTERGAVRDWGTGAALGARLPALTQPREPLADEPRDDEAVPIVVVGICRHAERTCRQDSRRSRHHSTFSPSVPSRRSRPQYDAMPASVRGVRVARAGTGTPASQQRTLSHASANIDDDGTICSW